MSGAHKESLGYPIATATYATLFLGLFLGVLGKYFGFFEWEIIFIFTTVTFVFIFLLTHFRVRVFIYRSIKKIYDDVSLLEDAQLTPHKITTNMESLKQEVQKYATDKKLEIESLRIQEEYRKDFIGNVAHELKTPLFTVQGYILTLLDGAMNDKSVRKKYLQRADKGVERLIYLVNDLDMITKLEVGDMNLNYSYFDIVKLVKNSFELLEMKAAKRNITLTFDAEYLEPVMVNADEERIQQLLTNLLDNSIKYGKEDGTTEISIQHLIQNKILVRVTDNGEGISNEHLTRLFERFYRVDKSGNRKVGGSGLGLSIVKHIIEAHDERIYVESEFGVGSEFSFTLEEAEDIE
ncbi:sensor histidine kinase [Dokdonia sinensis]|uniref:histidine kinase n=1 Tax=Dokdonia sinensis TaxID=2479847 RepID=A0A3M0G0M9_9FLAO|nr:ATP-binding protein [Dokdonia sinensis]RMB58520.1 sensor histidine kinase [Dokdonia sinensis]